MMHLPTELASLLREAPALSRAYLVGGCVRDSLLGIVHKDFDLEVYGMGYEMLAQNSLAPVVRINLDSRPMGPKNCPTIPRIAVQIESAARPI